MTFRPETIKKDFPIFQKKIHQHNLIYLDNAATTQKPASVLDALDGFYTQHNANVHRGIHLLSEEATHLYEQSRVKIQKFISAQHSDEIIFTSGTTQALNLVAQGYFAHQLQPGQHILLTQMEHHANLLPWQRLAQQLQLELRFIPIDHHGQLVENWSEYITDQTAVVAITHTSNLLGTTNPIAQISAAAHQAGALVVLDAAQSAPHYLLNVQQLDVDFAAFSGHKMLGPTGIGVLYGRRQLLDKVQPLLLGGEMIERVTWQQSTWRQLPHRLEAGTPPIAQAIGLAAAIEYLQALPLQEVQGYLEELTQYGLQQLQTIPGLKLFASSPSAHRSPIFSFTLSNIHPHDIADLLDQQGIAVRSGHHCAQPLTELLQVPATTRASLYFYNTRQDIDQLTLALTQIQEKFSQ